jgi:hypothetical protein
MEVQIDVDFPGHSYGLHDLLFNQVRRESRRPRWRCQPDHAPKRDRDVWMCVNFHHRHSISSHTRTVYIFGSLLAFDPWHLVTSLLPYMLLAPTYINILNMYVSLPCKQDAFS